jgi:hypothetical protein
MSAWAAGMQHVNDEAAGLFNVNIIDAATGAELLAGAMAGDREAATLLDAVRQAVAQVNQAPRKRPSLCMCCPRPVKRITPATVFGVALPAVSAPSTAIGFVFCDRCGAGGSDLLAKAAEGLRRIWRDLRPVAITHPAGGRA